MHTSGARSGRLGSCALMFIVAATVAPGCAPAKRQGPPPSPDVGSDGTVEAKAGNTFDVDASEDGLQVSGTVDLSGAMPQVAMTASVGRGLSKDTIETICFAPSSSKLPADTSAKLGVVAKAFRSEKNEENGQRRITVEPMIVSRDTQVTASKVRAERAAAVVGALVKQGVDRNAIVVTGPEVPRTEWSIPMLVRPFGEEPPPCVEVAVVTAS
ncbi:MAG: hypothetical protein KF850_20275 [Labilithrix sp.]|nr:hypothetical protein [Labilithrix sp.]